MVCHNIKIRPNTYARENSYHLGNCVSKQKYENMQDYNEECCLAPGDYDLYCKCSRGDGWHGGYIEIDGKKYCDDFMDGFAKIVRLSFN